MLRIVRTHFLILKSICNLRILQNRLLVVQLYDCSTKYLNLHQFQKGDHTKHPSEDEYIVSVLESARQDRKPGPGERVQCRRKFKTLKL